MQLRDTGAAMSKRETQAFRDQQADAIDRNPTIECNDERCERSENVKCADGWLLHNDPEIPVLCPECRNKVPENKQTPTEYQREVNAQITEWGE